MKIPIRGADFNCPSTEITTADHEEAKKMAVRLKHYIANNPVKSSYFNKTDDAYKQDHDGYLGQACFARFYDLPHLQVLGGDLYDFTLCGKTVDVKTKMRNVDPRSDYVAEIAEELMVKTIDVYVFLSINERTQTCFFVGFLPKAEFDRKARIFKEGETRLQGSYEYTCLHTAYEVFLSELQPMSKFRTYCAGVE